ncbi:MAG: TlpA disulfide reductase family protein [Planctomycetaceae bacterium]
MTRWSLLLLTLLTFSLAGCGGSGDTGPDTEPEVPQPGSAVIPEAEMTPAPEGQSEETVETEEVTASIKSWEETEEFIRGQSGKVVVMDLWTTYCAPCRKEFPNLVALHHRLGDKVTCLSVALDYDGLEDYPVEKCREDVLKFLQEQEAVCTNVVCSTAAEDIFGKKIPHQAVPAIYVFNRAGEIVGQFPDTKAENPDEAVYENHVIPLVEKLLAE